MIDLARPRVFSIAVVAFWVAAALPCLADEERGAAAEPALTDRAAADEYVIGQEVGTERRLRDGEEFRLSLAELVDAGRQLFDARWTVTDGAGRPRLKGTGTPLGDPSRPLVGVHAFHRLSGPDANACSGCHNSPHGWIGGGGDVVANAFVLGQRFDRLDLDDDPRPMVSARDELGRAGDLRRLANERVTPGLFGSGYIEMFARQLTDRLLALRDTVPFGGSVRLLAYGIDFGTLRRIEDGRWDTDDVVGLPPTSLVTFGSDDPPPLTVKPFHRTGAVASIREFTNNALVQHHGLEPAERFGAEIDADGDGVAGEISRAEVTALVVFQATLPVPGRRIPRIRAVEEAVLRGESLFVEVGCSSCHVPAVPLEPAYQVLEEPGPFNSDRRLRPGQWSERSLVNRNLRPGEAPPLRVDLGDPALPAPRLHPGEPTTGATTAAEGDRRAESSESSVIWVPTYSDFRLHDITSGPDDPNAEALDQHFSPGSNRFFAGNRKFLTARLWGVGNQRPYFHHGRFTTLREAIGAHAGEAEASRRAYDALSEDDRAAVIEMLKSLQVLPADTPARVVDERGEPRAWPPSWAPPAAVPALAWAPSSADSARRGPETRP